MSYELLLSLYFAEGSNADLTTRAERDALHVQTPVEGRITAALREGLDVVLTGNPGDGKSHLVRTLEDRGALAGAKPLLDLSAVSTEDGISEWRQQVEAGRRFVMCANEGPLLEFLRDAERDAALRDRARELRLQIGHLTVSDEGALPPRPARVMLIDLADRNVLSETLITNAMSRVCREEFLPDLGPFATDCSAGRNLLLLQNVEPRQRLARILALAGMRLGEHVTFRRLWQAIALAITGGKSEVRLKDEARNDVDSPLGSSPLDNLTRRSAKGALVEAVRRFADPAMFTDPDLDESLWHTGNPPGGEWITEEPHGEPPANLWAEGRQDAAFDQLRCLKRLVALGHQRGEDLLQAMERGTALPSRLDERALLRAALLGVRRLYLSANVDTNAPEWLRDGLPLWVGFSYDQTLVEERPHVAVVSLPEDEFELLRPRRPPWLGDALGPLPECAWLRHSPSGIALRINPELLAALCGAATTAGPVAIPEPVHRFVTQLAGWDEVKGERPLGDEHFAVIACPRGEIEAEGRVRTLPEGGASYV